VAAGEPDTTTVLDLIDQLEELVTTSRRLPFTATVVINEDETLDLIDRARMGLPEELVQARHTLEDRDRIVAAAETEAEAILARAESEAQQLITQAGDHAEGLVSEHAVLAEALTRGEALVAEAEAQAAAIREEADAYAREVMVQLEEHLNRALGTVRKGIETLPRATPPRRRKKS